MVAGERRNYFVTCTDASERTKRKARGEINVDLKHSNGTINGMELVKDL